MALLSPLSPLAPLSTPLTSYSPPSTPSLEPNKLADDTPRSFELILPADRHRLDDVLEQLNQLEVGDVYKRAAEAVVNYLESQCDVWLEARMATVTRVIVDERVKAEKHRRDHRFWYWRSQQLKEQQLTGDDRSIPNVNDVSIDFFLDIVTAKSKFRRKIIKPPTRPCRKKQTIEFPARFTLVDGEAVPQGRKKAATTTTSGGTQTSPSPWSPNSGRPEIPSRRSGASTPRSPSRSPAESRYRVNRSASAERSRMTTPRSISEISDDEDLDDDFEPQPLIQPMTEWSTQLATPFLTLPTLPTTPSPAPPAFRSWELSEDECLADRLIQSSTVFRGHSKTPKLTLPSAKEVQHLRDAAAPTARVISVVPSRTEDAAPTARVISVVPSTTEDAAAPTARVISVVPSKTEAQGAASPSLFVESPAYQAMVASTGLFVESPASSSQSSTVSSPRLFGESPASPTRSSARPSTDSVPSSPGPLVESLNPSCVASPGLFAESPAQTPAQTRAQAPAPAPAPTSTKPFQPLVRFPSQNSAQSLNPLQCHPPVSRQVAQFSTETVQFLNFPSNPAAANAASQDLAQVDGSVPQWNSAPANVAPQDLAQVDHSMPQWNSASTTSYLMPAMAEAYTANLLRQDCALAPSMSTSEYMPVSYPVDPMISAVQMTDYDSHNVSGVSDAAVQYNAQMAAFSASTPVANFGTSSNTGMSFDQNSFLSPLIY